MSVIREGKGGSVGHGEARALPSKLVLELFAVHMPICFVIAGLFLGATGVSRKPDSVDCVAAVWGVRLFPRDAEGMCESGGG